MSEIFISYKRIDRLKAQAIAKALAKQGYSVWWDIELLPGDRFLDEITAVINQTKVAIVLWSKEAVTSTFVLAEAKKALDHKILVPVRLDNCQIPLPYEIFETLDLSNWSGSSNDSLLTPLISAVEKKIGYIPTPIHSLDTVNKILEYSRGEVEFWRSVTERVPQEIKEYQMYISRYGEEAVFLNLAKARIQKLEHQPPEQSFISKLIKILQVQFKPSRSPIYSKYIIFLLVPAIVTGCWVFKTDIEKLMGWGPILCIESDPKGALVYVDDGEAGLTPLEIDVLTDGVHTIRINLDKYEPYEKRIFLQRDKPEVIHASLLPEPYGDLEINSIPEGASVLIDGESKGKTPLNISRFLKGVHKVELNHEDFVVWNSEVTIEPLEEAKIFAKLITAFGYLEAKSTPTGASVTINNKRVGTTPFTSKKMRIGEYNIAIEKPKYGRWSTTASINSGDVTPLHAKLAFVYGSLSVMSESKDAVVFVDGKRQGKTPLELSLIQGKHEIEVRPQKTLHAPWQKEVTIEANKSQLVTATFKFSPTYTDAVTGMEFVYIPGGCYQMGDTFRDGESDEQPVHEVCLNGFYCGKYEVTQGEYTKVIDSNPSKLTKGDRYPVENVSWEHAQTYIRALNNQTGKNYRLPTEAEWEYAARSGGKHEKYSGSNRVENVAWYESNSNDSPHKVGTKEGNGFGLHDMSGNVWEWCNDWYGADYYSSSPQQNPKGPLSGRKRVMRGGRWSGDSPRTRSANRGMQSPNKYNATIGYRLVLQADVPSQ